MEALEQQRSTQYLSPEADRAYGRIDAILRAYGISHAAARSQFCLSILEEASNQCSGPNDSLESQAADIALERLRRGVKKVAEAAAIDGANAGDLYLALQAAAIPQDHPDVLLGNAAPSDPLCESIRAYYERQSRPTLRRVSMGASPLRFDAIDEVADTTERFLQRHRFLRQLLKLLLIGTTLVLVYRFAR